MYQHAPVLIAIGDSGLGDAEVSGARVASLDVEAMHIEDGEIFPELGAKSFTLERMRTYRSEGQRLRDFVRSYRLIVDWSDPCVRSMLKPPSDVPRFFIVPEELGYWCALGDVAQTRLNVTASEPLRMTSRLIDALQMLHMLYGGCRHADAFRPSASTPSQPSPQLLPFVTARRRCR